MAKNESTRKMVHRDIPLDGGRVARITMPVDATETDIRNFIAFMITQTDGYDDSMAISYWNEVLKAERGLMGPKPVSN